MVIDGSGYLFLAIVCLGVPYLAWKSSQGLGDRPLPMSRKRFFLQTIFAQIYLFAIGVLAATRNDIDLLAKPASPLSAWGMAAGFVVVLVAVMWWRWPQRDRDSKERLYRMLPHERGDLPAYFAVCVAAGVCEETVYRGVTAVLLTRLTGNLMLAVLVSAVVFALAHVIQGWRSMVAVFGIALMAHAIVLATQSLFPVMVAHALYDAIAGVLMPRWYVREIESAQQQVLSQTTPMR